MYKRLLCLTLAVLLLLPSASAFGRVSLFIGDKAFREDTLLPFLETAEGDLLPAKAFAEIDGLSVTQSDAFGSLLLTYKERYLSYDLQGGTKRDEAGRKSAAKIYRYGGEYYLAADEVCEAFGLHFETDYDVTGTRCARLTDGSETLSFAELRSYVSGTSADAALGAVNLRVPSIRTIQGTFLYPMLLFPAVRDTETLVRLLGSHKATFVLAPSEIQKYAEVLPAIYAGGHTIAYFLPPTQKGAERLRAFKAEMEAANDYLFAVVGKTSRLYISTAENGNVPAIDGFFGKRCQLHLVDNDLTNEHILSLVLTESPSAGSYNFSIANDRETRKYYSAFFKVFDQHTELRAMPMTEAGAAR